MNPPMFFVFKVNEDSQECVEDIYKIVYVMGFTTVKKSY